MYTYEEYSQKSTLSGYLTGTITGWLKYSTLNEKEKVQLAKQLLWCYEQSGAEMLDSTRKEIEEILSKKS
jgi:hypothetical protein